MDYMDNVLYYGQVQSVWALNRLVYMQELHSPSIPYFAVKSRVPCT